ncbi:MULTISPECIES: hypothetical protein [unclassified Novosphingobium]|uniref:hypothetical protein n=1 Tax=unclassified Novosphingobium TaxID=2644732 RepID=UPI00135C30A3|nr:MULTISPECIES: hypothetical protein [unclassified Novosphingobium]
MASTLNEITDDRTRAKRLREFLHDCAGSAPCEEAERVRDAVLELGGSGLDAKGPIDVTMIHAMLDSGAVTSAVLELMGPGACFMLSRGPQGACLASVVLRDGAEEAIAEASSLGLALLGAHVAAVLAQIEKASFETEALPAPAWMRVH